MKAASIVCVCGAIVLAGCATNRAYRPGASGGGGVSPIPNTSPDLGVPSDSFQEKDRSSNYPPSRSGPSLGPEAFGDDPPLRSSRTAKLAAPAPRKQTARYRPEVTGEPVSSGTASSLLNEPTWNRSLKSSDRRPIESLTMGKGARRIAIMGSLHGDEPQSVSLVEELTRHARKHPEMLAGNTLLIVRSPNPDGLYERSPYNIHGVDLNRNFPSANWKALASGRAGTSAASEAETRAVVRLLGDFKPELVIHVKEGHDSSAVNYEGQVEERADRVAELLGCQVVTGLGEKTSGSVENYASTRLACPSLTLLAPRQASDQEAWARHRDALLAAISAKEPSSRRETSQLEEPDDPFEQPSMHQSSLRKPRSSDSELLRLPASRKQPPRNELPDFPAPVPDHGYLELPPP